MFMLIVITAIIGLVVGWLTYNPFWGLATWVLLGGGFILQGLRKILAQPPHKAIRTILGKRQDNKVVNEGFGIFPLYPWWHGFIPINVTKVNQDLPEQLVRTPDRAESSVPISLTWTPNKNDPKSLIEFLNTGGENGVKTILEDIVRERLREWAFSIDEGPKDWQELMGAREEAVAILLKAIVGKELTAIPTSAQSIPTSIWLKYFVSPRKTLTENEQRVVGKDWGNVDKLLSTLESENPDETEKIKKAVEDRRKEIKLAQQGNGNFAFSQLGIILNRLNIGEIKPKGELAKIAEIEARETQERKGEVFEVDTDLMKARRLVEAAKEKGEDLSLQQAFQIIMEWKATREGRGFTIPGLSPAVGEILKAILGRG